MANLVYILLLPIFWVGHILAIVLQASTAVLGTTGFLIGLFVGLAGGYWVFLASLSTGLEDPKQMTLTSEGGHIDDALRRKVLPELPIWVQSPDHDRVDWLNNLVQELWPYLGEAVSNQAKAQLAPMLAQYKPAVLQSIVFDEFNLGTLPPTVTGVKVYDTADDEMIIEPVVKWAGNPNIIVAANMYGLKATVQLVDLTAFATVRLILKPLVDVFPCFSRVTMSLMSRPTIDFGIKVIGGDVMAIPGLYSYLQETLKNIVSDMFLWPKAYEVYKVADVEGGRPIGWLYVKNVRASNIANIEKFGKSDPYLRLSLGDKMQVRNSSVKYDNLDPVWQGEEFQMLVKDPQTQYLQLQILDKNTGGPDKLMSQQTFALKDLAVEEPKQVTLPLLKVLDPAKAAGGGQQPTEEAGLGEIYCELTYKPFAEGEAMEGAQEEKEQNRIPDDVPVGGGLVKVTLKSGEELEGKHHSNPYVKIRFRKEEKKTRVYKKETDLEFDDDPFVFVVREAPTDDVVHAEVYSKNTSLTRFVDSKSKLGTCDIPLNDVVSNGKLTDFYGLVGSKAGKLKVEVEWIEKKAEESKEEKNQGAQGKPTGTPVSTAAAS